MVAEGAAIIKQSDGRGGFKYPINSIRILKANGKSMRESVLINGFALNCVIAMQGKVEQKKNHLVLFAPIIRLMMIKIWSKIHHDSNLSKVIHVYESIDPFQLFSRSF